MEKKYEREKRENMKTVTDDGKKETPSQHPKLWQHYERNSLTINGLLFGMCFTTRRSLNHYSKTIFPLQCMEHCVTHIHFLQLTRFQ